MGCCYPWTLSLYSQGITSVLPHAVQVKNDADVVRLFTVPLQPGPNADKRRTPCWSPAIYTAGARRKNENVNLITALVYDFDDTSVSPKEVHTALKGKLAHVIHTSWSHTDDAPRFRLILPLTEALSPARFVRAWTACLAWLGYTEDADPQCKDLARLYLLPASRPDRSYEAYMDLTSPPLDAATLPVAPPKPKPINSLLSRGTALALSNGVNVTVGDLVAQGEGKYRCACPFEPQASQGSAFFRILQDGRAFLQCTSDRHVHPGRKFWLSLPSTDPLSEVPSELRSYVNNTLAYSAPQGVFYHSKDGRWAIDMPWRTDALHRHLIGKLPEKCGAKHARALTETVLRRQVYGFGYSSTASSIIDGDEPLLNLYAPPDVEPTPGQYPRILEVLEVLTDGDRKAMKWLVHWSAALAQRPERRGMVSTLVISPQQGIGKSMYGNVLATIIGRANSTVVSTRALRDSFNASFVAKLLVLADEVGIRSSHKDVVADLKAYITDERVHCAAPYAPRLEVENRMTWWMTSNEPHPLVIEEDDRRFTVFLCGHADPHYRDMLRGCFSARTGTYSDSFLAEISSFSHALHKVRIDYNLISRPLSSHAKRELQGISLGSTIGYVREMQKAGAMAMLSGYPPADPAVYRIQPTDNCVPCAALYHSYRTWCDQHGRRDVAAEGPFRLSVARTPDVSVRTVTTNGQRIRIYSGLPKTDDSSNLIAIS